MRNRVLSASALLITLLSGCEVASDPAAMEKSRYFDVAGFLDQSISELETSSATLTKTITHKGEAPQTARLVKPDWKAELEPFRDAELNRPAWRKAFSIDSARQADGSVAVTYRRRPGQKVPLQEATLHLNPHRQLQLLELELEDNNMLFYNRKRLTMEAVPGGKPAIRHYTISGTQKMIASDSLNYQVKGMVR